ncbi:MAG: hypothetical protein COW30_16045 [Rhodospirillales bacterium CG15_BIG_FIL_POST_REV_8_21_14_020_66_15]|nr:MAG: hypothetical protein COW30_16045 [Rhodospirillales bacterium CG15_BIG_FIL_POST_REV_8_21_14_020_66_15]
MPRAPSDTPTTTGRSHGLHDGHGDPDSRLLDFARASADWFWETDADDRFTYVSDQVTAAAGVSPADWTGKSRQDLHPVVAQDTTWDAYRRVVAAREPYRDFTFVAANADGTTFPIAISGVPVFEGGRFMGYRGTGRRVSQGEAIEKLVRNVVNATSQAVGRDFLELVATALCRELTVDQVYISRLRDDGKTAESLVAVVDGELVGNIAYGIVGGPCETVTRDSTFCVYPRRVADLFPDDRFLAEEGIEGYIGLPLYGAGGRCLGLMVAMSREPLILEDVHKLVFEFFAGRVAAEMGRAVAEEELTRRDALLSAIIDNLPHGLTVKDPEGRYILVNKEFSRRYGLCDEDILGLSNEERFADWGKDWAASKAQEKDVATTGRIIVRELDRRFADGTEHRLEIVKFPIPDRTGRMVGVGALGVDITERTRWEREARDRERVLESYHQALDRIVASDAMASPDAQDAFELLTRVAAETLGVERVSVWRARPELSNIECLDLYRRTPDVHERGVVLERESFPRYFEALRQVEVIDAHDARSDPRTGEFAEGYLDTHGITSLLDAAVHIGDELKGVLCLEHVGEPRHWTLEEQSLARSLAALTSLILARQEQQEADRARQSVEQRFSEIVNALPSSLSLKDRDQRYVFVNKVYERNYGVRADEAFGRTIRDLGVNNEAILQSIEAEDTAVLAEGRSFTKETTRIGRDGVERSALVSKFPVYDKDGKVELVATLWTDISEQKAVQVILEGAQARLRAITDNVPMMLCLKGLDGRYVEGNTGFARWHGRDVKEIPGLRSGDLLNPRRAAVVEGLDQRVIETGEVVVDEAVSELRRRPDGQPTIFRMIKFPVRDAEERIIAVGTAMMDITEQKLAQRALEETQARLMAITDNVPIMLSLKDKNGVYRHCNAKFAEWHGIRPDQVIGKTLHDLLPPERAAAIERTDREVLRAGEVRVLETDTVFGHLKDGEPMTLRQFKFPIRDSAGVVTGVGTAMLDITDERRAEKALQTHLEKLEDVVADRTVELTQEIAERRHAEAELRRTEANLRAILEISPVGVAVVARDPRRRLFVNRSFLGMFGAATEDDLNSVPMSDTYADPADFERLAREFDETDAIVAQEVQRKRLDGSEWWALVDARSVEFEGERAALVWHYDITDRKNAAEALARQAETLEQAVAARTRELRESEQLLNSIFEHLPVGVLIKDAEHRLVRANITYTNWYGVKPEKLIGSKGVLVEEYQTPEDAAIREAQEQAVLKTGEIQTREVERRFLDGRLHTVNVTKFPIFDDKGKVTRVGSVAIDVTQEVEARKALQRHQRLLRSLIDNLPVAIIMAGQSDRYSLVNQTFCDWYGLGMDDVVGNDIPGLAARMNLDGETIREQDLRTRTTGETHSRETKRAFADGSIHNLLITKYPFRDETGEVTGVVSVSIDLTDQVEARRRLEESERLLRYVVDNLPVGLTIKDSDGRYIQFNKTLVDWHSLDENQVLGLTFEQGLTNLVIDPEEAREQERKVIETGKVNTRETTRRFADGRMHDLLVTKYLVPDTEGRPYRIVSVIQDLTDLRDRERQLSTLVENVPGLVFRTKETRDGEFRIQFVSEGVEAITGYSPAEVMAAVNSGDLGIFHPEDLKVRQAASIAGYAAGVPVEVTCRLFHRNGEVRWVMERKRAVERTDDGWIVEGLILDVTERKLADDALRQSQAWLRAFTDNLPIFLNLKDTEGRYLFVNRLFAEIRADKTVDYLGKTPHEAFPDHASDDLIAIDREVLATGEVKDFESPAISKELAGRLLRFIKFPVADDDGVVIGIGTAAMDITDKKKAEDAIRESEAKLQAITQNVPMLLNLKDLGGRYQFVNESYSQWVRKPVEEIIGRTVNDLFDGEIAGRRVEQEAEVLRTGEPVEFETQALSDDCQGERTLRYIKFPVRDDEGAVFGIGTAIMDVTDRKRAELALKESEARFRGLFENAPAGITIKTTTGRYLAMNKTFLDWKGWNLVDVVGRRPSELLGPEVGERTDQEDAQVVARQSPFMKEVVIKCADGRNLITTNVKAPMLTPDGQVTGVCSFYVDVSETREIEAQLQQAQKMEAIGRLAGGIAHDFNNLLGAMMGFNEFLIEDLPEDTPQHNFARRVARAGERAKQLVSQILAFSRASHGELSVVDLNMIGEEAATLLSGTLPVTTRVVFQPSDAQVTALTNAGQMSQVLMNLGVNANDALSGADGVINIGIERIPAGSHLLALHDGPIKTMPEDFMDVREVRDGAWQVVAGVIDPGIDHVLIYVEDTGPGIPENVLRRLFEPFFTTKEAGKGTGLGLPVVHGIVTAHHGALRVRTRLGAGTRFEVLLPCAAPASERDTGDELAEKIEGRGMILVVDDESDVADMVSIGLERLGYEVGVCSSGEEALDVFRETPDLWRAVISDHIMPDMRGMDLIEKIKAVRPHVPCILCTGYSDTLTDETARAGGADAFFQKPVSASRLGRMLADLLGG